MHECPNCGQACDCIGDDTWDDSEAAACEHDCEDFDDDELWNDIEDGYDGEG